MKTVYLSLLAVFSTFFMVAQDKNSTIDSIQKRNIQVIDSISVTSFSGDLPTTVVTTRIKDTMVFNLEDMARARKIDSIWLKELFTTGRFEEMYGSVLDETYEPVEYEELPTEVLKQRLEELNARTPFNVAYNTSLESVIKGYLKNRRKTLARLMALSDYYFPMFEEILDKHGLPLEMKYLAIVESALEPRATSRVGAQGLWQFMFSTGKMFGLDVNSFVDERSDPIMATEAAAQYLKSLEKSLGDWDLALAAYNSGPGNVAKALRRANGQTNYWNIRKYLPRETAGYVPAFLATMYIFEFAEEHGFKSEGPQYPFIATDTIRVQKMITLQHVAEVTNLDIEEVRFLNPSYKKDVIPVIKDENYVLRLPIDAVGKFVSNEQAIYAYAEKELEEREKPLPELFEQEDKIRYRVRSGDYLGKIAEKYGVSVSSIKRWNGLRNNRLRVGQRLTIHPRNLTKAVAANGGSNSSSSATAKTYTVKNGDSLWSISQKFPGVSVDNLKKWNDIGGTKLKPGMKLTIQKG
jgi:membrane-bound lytic murein transglycosylase D